MYHKQKKDEEVKGRKEKHCIESYVKEQKENRELPCTSIQLLQIISKVQGKLQIPIYLQKSFNTTPHNRAFNS